jgi:hypothetical protein
MRNRLLETLMLAAFATVSTTALADDAPARVGRVALTQGQVSVSAEGAETMTAQANWPVTSSEMITTARGARTELQIGSTFVRLDGDSSLEVVELDDDNLRLRLHYGSASIRILDAGVVPGFELTTPEGRVRMQEPGRVRVDAERVADTSSVTVFDGLALVENGGASLTVRAGKRADLQDDDVRTVAATRDGFDDWSLARDRAAEAPAATRYVSADMTGYSDLDRYGSWRTDSEYGPLWAPNMVAPGWTPYSDGSWVWMDPWGWTWVDNAPWGYAPFHYGRWVYVHNRWCWTPGHREHRPVWAPALVGWVGGSGWNVNFSNRHQMPARGWYPLSPHERFVPGYHLRDEHLRRLNGDVRPDFRHREPEHRGITVVPQEQFAHRGGQVQVNRLLHAVVPVKVAQAAPVAAPPAPPEGRHDWRPDQRRGDERVIAERGAQQHEGGHDERGQRDGGRFEHRGDDRFGHERRAMPAPQPDHPPPQQPVTVLTAPPVLPGGVQQQRQVIPEHREPPPPISVLTPQPPAPGQPQQPLPVIPEHRAPPQPVTVLTAPPVLPGQQPQVPPQMQWRPDHRERFDERREQRDPSLINQQHMQAPAERFQRRDPPPAAQQRMQPPAEQFERRDPPAAAQQRMQPPVERFERRDPPPPPAAMAAPMQPPMMRQMQQSAPAPAAHPAPAAGPAPAHHGGHDDKERKQER